MGIHFFEGSVPDNQIKLQKHESLKSSGRFTFIVRLVGTVVYYGMILNGFGYFVESVLSFNPIPESALRGIDGAGGMVLYIQRMRLGRKKWVQFGFPFVSFITMELKAAAQLVAFRLHTTLSKEMW